VKFVRKKIWRVAKIMQTILFFAESLLFPRGEDIGDYSIEKFPIFREKIRKKMIFGKNFDFSENTQFGKKSELLLFFFDLITSIENDEIYLRKINYK
jgi:hypothetical protein